MIKFNMNNYVWFKPTGLGEKVYKDYFTQLGFEEPHNKLKMVDGKACLQFHNFIQIYGDYITSYICKDKKSLKNMSFMLTRRICYDYESLSYKLFCTITYYRFRRHLHCEV